MNCENTGDPGMHEMTKITQKQEMNKNNTGNPISVSKIDQRSYSLLPLPSQTFSFPHACILLKMHSMFCSFG